MKHHEKLNDALHIIIREAHRLRFSLILSLIFDFSKTKHLKTFRTDNNKKYCFVSGKHKRTSEDNMILIF